MNPRFVQWNELGDDPSVEHFDPVRLFAKNLGTCPDCGKDANVHGWIPGGHVNLLPGGTVVCPGDYIVEDDAGGLRVSKGYARESEGANTRTCSDCCKRDVCMILKVIDAAREATVQALQQQPWTEEQVDRLDEMWQPLRGMAEVCLYFMETHP